MKIDFHADNTIRMDLEITGDVWPVTSAKTLVLLVALSVPGYYSLPVRILSLVARYDSSLAGFDCRYLEEDQHVPILPLAERIAAWTPDIVGISINIWNRNESFRLASELKKLLPQLKVLVGGQEVTHSVEDYLSTVLAIDYIIDGEGEIAFGQFLRAWDNESKMIVDPQRVSGLHYRNDGRVSFTRPVELVSSLDEVPSAILAGLVPVHGKDKLGVLLEGARGCPYRCAFCFEGDKRGGVRLSSIERISQEATYMASAGSTYFHVMDPILCNGKLERLQRISEFFLNLREQYKAIIISVETYAEHITEEVAPHLRAFTIIDVGLQTTNPTTVTAIHRRFIEAKFRRGIDLLRRTGSRINIYLIIGLPYETPLSFLKGLDFALGEFPVKIFINELCLLNGTELRRRAEEFGYEFSLDPPYMVSETPWFPQRLLSLFQQLSKDLEWSYNLSMQSVYANAPWFTNQSAATTETHAIWIGGQCNQGCSGCRTARETAIRKDVVMALSRVTPNSDVDLLVGEEPDAALLYNALGQVHLAGVARIRLVAPPFFFRNRPRLNEVLTRGAWHMRTFFPAEYMPGYGTAMSEEVEDVSTVFRGLDSIFPLRKRGVLRPYYEVVVNGNSLTAEDGVKLWQHVSGLAFTALSIPDNFLEKGSSEQYATMFWETIERGKWLRLPEDEFKKAVIADDETCRYMKKFGMFNRHGDRRPCFVPEDSP